MHPNDNSPVINKQIDLRRQQQEQVTTSLNPEMYKKTVEEKVELANHKLEFKKNNPDHKFKQTFVLGSDEVKVINHKNN